MKAAIGLSPFQEQHIPAGMRLKTLARWNQVESDWHLMLRLSSGGSFVAKLGGQVLGTTLTIAYPGFFSWVGMVLVDPAYRGKGIGTQLLKAALTYAQPKGPVLLDATALGQNLYHTLGFQDMGEIARLELVAPHKLRIHEERNIRRVENEVLPRLMEYDQSKVLFQRSAVLEDMIRREPAYAFVAYEHEQMTGYVVGRTGSRFHHIGPLLADGLEVAQALLVHALAAAPPSPVIIDVPLRNRGWHDWLLQQGGSVQRSFSRMCLGKPEKAWSSLNQYAIAGPALG